VIDTSVSGAGQRQGLGAELGDQHTRVGIAEIQELTMKILGVLLAFAGGLIPAVGLTLTQSVSARMFLAILGIAVALGGILGVLNPVHQKSAVWRRS
jgi:predicted phage tail protein